MTRQQKVKQIDDIRDLVSEAMNHHTDMKRAQDCGVPIDVEYARNRLNACREEMSEKLYALAGLA